MGHDEDLIVLLVAHRLYGSRRQAMRRNTFIRTPGSFSSNTLTPLLHPPPGIDTSMVMKEKFRMTLTTFRKLLSLIEATGYKGCGGISAEECLCIFLTRMATGDTERRIRADYQRPLKDVSKVIADLTYLLRKQLYKNYVVNNPISWKEAWQMAYACGSGRDKNLNAFFDGVVGYVDGTLISCHDHRVSKPLMSRKGFYAYNAMLVVDSLGQFRYAHIGAGCNHDSTVLRGNPAALRLPVGSFLLGDAGFAYSPSVLTPLRGVRYHLLEWSQLDDQKPKTPEELFNKRHSTLRITIEIAIGRLKSSWKFLTHARVHKKLFYITFDTLLVLHNYILQEEKQFNIHEDIEPFVKALRAQNASLARPEAANGNADRNTDEVTDDEEEEERESDAANEGDLAPVRLNAQSSNPLRGNIMTNMWRWYAARHGNPRNAD